MTVRRSTPGGSKTSFNDPWNPSHDEIVAWAHDADAPEPEQDWDLALAHERHTRTYVLLAADDGCPKREYFLHVLYLIIGDAVRSEYAKLARPLVEGVVDVGNAYPHADIIVWQQRSRHLMRNPQEFEYNAWCAGGLARYRW